MILKLAIIVCYSLAVLTPAGLLAGQRDGLRDCENRPGQCDDAANQPKKLDLNGKRGVVCFRHKSHEAYVNPDPGFVHQKGQGAECVGCHHSRSDVSGVPMLWKCSACHRSEGHPDNPRNRDGDEVWSERAFHDLCIGCHRASNERGLGKCRAPVACGDCHASKS